jgi:hypothetical protein
MSIPPIIIEITHKNVHLLYNIDFEHFKDEMTKIPSIEFVDSYCFDGVMLIGIKVTCNNINKIIIMKRFLNFFTYRWKIEKSEIKANFDNKQSFLDYQH